jgi:hypothetical protein
MKNTVLRRKKERGFTVVLFALMIFVVLGFTGLAVDVGYLQLEKRKVQAAADAAAMGALREMELGNTDLVAAGQNDASLNGFTDGHDNTTVTILNPPTSGTYANQTSAVSATVTKVVPTFFMRAMGQNSVTVSSTAVAQTSTGAGSVGGCIFVMNATAGPAFKVDGGATLSTACSVMVKSTDSSALTMGGNSAIDLSNGAIVGVVGPGKGYGWNLNPNSTILNTTTNATELPVNMQTFSDPLASVTAPTLSTITSKTYQTNGNVASNTTVTLNPGIYCGGINVQGTANFTSGTYILAGGGFTTNSTGVSLNDTSGGEMFYNTSSQGWGCPKALAAGVIKINGSSTTGLHGLTQCDGTTTNGVCSNPVGVLFFDDRSNSGLTHTINGTSTLTIDGALYFLPSYVKFAGTNQANGYTFLVSDTLEIIGTSNLGNDKSTLANVYTLAPASTGGGLVQ